MSVAIGRPTALTRVLVAFGIGIAISAGAGVLVSWELAALLGWDGAAVTFLAWVWVTIARMDSDQTAELASIEDDSRLAADGILIGATLVSLLGVAFVLFQASGERGPARIAMAIVAVLSVSLSWAAIHTIYTLRYAHLYYRAGGGIDFNADGPPDYRDFTYVAFTIGMTYQVSDTSITSRRIRMAALRHAGLSFVFGTGVIATTINLVADLYRG